MKFQDPIRCYYYLTTIGFKLYSGEMYTLHRDDGPSRIICDHIGAHQTHYIFTWMKYGIITRKVETKEETYEIPNPDHVELPKLSFI